ncbi:SusD/RagB family nutrient-binding outer membrane lipoprotein [Flammeovirga agarivorans]|uniref:SusD/RagB family nutrient-binding outer membrane lipoprotein n=1 Tax=Flammeovirga agarivorans TaxID=2726742 RepID=A0A7X8SL81_9BACT|nr:SusD/RagB family nutrient-binding outer membrane lipoprotein [Flammeovirga agarivorans]NLR92291.1 SusD/RagB family nutrient-binding outer membrane lipoprotein [Flammeovirga agarivorans]
MKLISAIVLSISLTSCFKDFDQLRENPNYPSKVDPESLFANVLYTSTGSFYGVQGQYFNLTAAGIWSQHFSKIQYIDEDWYEYRPSVMDEIWKRMYAGISGETNLAGLYDLELAIKAAYERKANNEEAGNEVAVRNDEALIGALKTAKAYFFISMTDAFGDIPYTEAFQTIELGYETTNFQPKYDDQEFIYKALLEELEEANALLAIGGSIDGGTDLIYRGSSTKWQKLANSLAARIYIRMSTTDPSFATEGLTALFANGERPMFESNADDAELQYLGSQPYMQPIYYNRYIDNRDDFAVSKTVVDMLKENNDNRLYIFAQPSPDSKPGVPVYVGQENGVPREESPSLNTISRIGNLFREQAAGKSFWMSYAEIQFIKAEAAYRLNVPVGDYQTFLEAGIRASFEKQYSEVAEYNAPIYPEVGVEVGQPGSDAQIVIDELKASGKDPMTQIMEQKYLALFSNGAEAFAELRRTALPRIHWVRGARQYERGLPNRFPYPFSEQTTNFENFSKAAQGIEQTVYGKKVWFAEKSPEIDYLINE